MTFHFLPRRWIDHAPRGHGNRAARRAFRNAALNDPGLLDKLETGTGYLPPVIARGCLLMAEDVCHGRATVRDRKLIGSSW